MKALDLFCGAGGASMGLHQAGMEVTGVDIRQQPRYPFKFMHRNALDLAPRELRGYDFIWASPPCQAFTRAQKIRKNAHPDLIEPIRRKLKKWGGPYVIENVEGAPLENPLTLCGTMFGLRTYRHRLFEYNFPIVPLQHPDHKTKVTKMGRPPRPDEFMHVVGNFSGIKEAREAMGIDWMSRDEIREAIPPAYSRYFAEAWIFYDSLDSLPKSGKK